jgi:hypothetical protein
MAIPLAALLAQLLEFPCFPLKPHHSLGCLSAAIAEFRELPQISTKSFNPKRKKSCMNRTESLFSRKFGDTIDTA